jgi:hypothetical protein
MKRSRVTFGIIAITFLVFLILVAVAPGRSTVARFSEEVAWTLFKTAVLSFLALCSGGFIDYTSGSKIELIGRPFNDRHNLVVPRINLN